MNGKQAKRIRKGIYVGEDEKTEYITNEKGVVYIAPYSKRGLYISAKEVYKMGVKFAKK